jgi:energy-converting hydrogenase A subunit R
MKDKVVCFDLEGPLSPQDNASDLLRLMPGGSELFRVISRYDDLLASEGRIGYEPGDTLALILPFIRWYGLRRLSIAKVSRNATIVPGAKELIEQCVKEGVSVYIVSTSYDIHAQTVGKRLGVPMSRIFSTRIDKSFWDGHFSDSTLLVVADAESYIRENFCDRDFDKEDLDRSLVSYLDDLYWNRLPRVGVSVIDGFATVVGGRRKILAVEKIARRHSLYLEDIVFVGDSITDAAVLRVVDIAGGLSISFNGNKFAIPCATLAVGSTSLWSLKPVFEAWKNGRHMEIKALVERLVQDEDRQNVNYVWRPSSDAATLSATIENHLQFRDKMRGHAAHLG